MRIGLGLGLSHIGRAATAPAGTVLAALFVNSQVFYDPTVAAPIPSITPGLTTNSQTFYTATVAETGGTQNISPGLLTNSQTFFTASVSSGLGAITLEWTSAPDNDIPEFNFDIAPPGSLAVNDVIRLQRAAAGTSFASPTAFPHTVTSGELSASTFDFGFTAWADASYDTRARQERPGAPDGDWSNTESVVISTGAAITAPLLTNTQTFYTATVADAGAAGHRYWQFEIVTSSGDTGVAFREVELRVNTVDQTTGATATASSTYESLENLPAHAIDNNFSTFWESQYDGTFPKTLTLDLGSNKDPTVFAARPTNTSRGAASFNINYSDTGTSGPWTAKKAFTGFTSGQWDATVLNVFSLVADFVTNGDFVASGTTTGWEPVTGAPTLAIASGALEVTATATGNFDTYFKMWGFRSGTTYRVSAKYHKGASNVTTTGCRIAALGASTGGAGTLLTTNSTTSDPGSPYTADVVASADGDLTLIFESQGGASIGDKIILTSVSVVAL